MNAPKDLERYSAYYTARKFWSKLVKYAKRIGTKAVYYALVLFYALQGKNLSVKDKRIIYGALGYLILPIDLFPDFLPAGFSDDIAALMLAMYRVARNITPDVLARADARIEEWFGEIPDEVKNLDITDFQK